MSLYSIKLGLKSCYLEFLGVVPTKTLLLSLVVPLRYQAVATATFVNSLHVTYFGYVC